MDEELFNLARKELMTSTKIKGILQKSGYTDEQIKRAFRTLVERVET